MAAQAKNYRQVMQDEILACIEEAKEAIAEAKEQKMKTHIVRTLQTRRNALAGSYGNWNKSCGEYSVKASSTLTPEDKKADTTVNIKPVRKEYLETLDELNDIIEEKLALEETNSAEKNRKEDLETKIKMLCKEIDIKIQNHKDRRCPEEVSKSAKDRMFKELDRDIIQPMEDVKGLYLDLLATLTDVQEKTQVTNDEEKWMDTNTKNIMNISDRYTSIPEIVTQGAEGLDSSALSSQSLAKASLRVKKADPPRFDGKIPSYPRFKKDFKALMQDYDDSSQVYYIRSSLPSEDRNLIKTLDTMLEVWAALDKRYKHSEIGANSLLESFGIFKSPPGSTHAQFTAIYLKYKELKDGLESLDEMQYLRCNPAFRKVLLGKLPVRMKERFLEREAKKKEESDDGELDRFKILDDFMEYQFRISMSVESVDKDESTNKPKCFACGSVDHKKIDCPDLNKGKRVGRNFNAANTASATVLPCRCCQLTHVNPFNGKQFTRLSRCDKFRNMDLQSRVKELERLKACVMCLDSTGNHQRDNCTAKSKGGEPYKPCSMVDSVGKRCDKRHNPWVHGGTSSYVNVFLTSDMSGSENVEELEEKEVDISNDYVLTVPMAVSAVSTACHDFDELLLEDVVDGPDGPAPVADEQVLLLMQLVPCRAGTKNVSSLVFWDHGSTMGMITFKHAKTLNLKGWDVSQWVQVASKPWELWKTKIYLVPLVDKFGNIHRVKCFGAESITSKLEKVYIDGVVHSFPELTAEQLARPHGAVQILIGLNQLELLPEGPIRKDGGLGVYESIFGTGYVLAGTHPSLKQPKIKFSNVAFSMRTAVLGLGHRVNLLAQRNVDQAFPFLDEIGLEPPARCTGCTRCKECTVRAQKYSAVEAAELVAIEERIKVVDGHAIAEYPFIKDPSVLKDNFEQVKKRALAVERRLERAGEMECYNKQFEDFIARGAISEISDEEIKSYEGPVNYVDHHPVHNPGSLSTPYRVVVNSSLDNNNQGISVNDLWPKGPNSLTPLKTCVVHWRSAKRVVVWDLSKCYQRILTPGPHTGNPLTRERHCRRLIWRFGKKDEDFIIFGFNVVTYGDRPASTILEVVKRVMEELGVEIDEETARLMGEASYVDDCMIGFEEIEKLTKFLGKVTKSEDGTKFAYTGTIAQILKLVGFEAKCMIVDHESDDDVIKKFGKKFLGITWSAKPDLIEFKYHVNISAKTKKGREEPDINEETLDLLEKKDLTLRIVTSVVHSWYDAAGLVSPFTMKFKLLLQETVSRSEDWDTSLPEDLQLKWKSGLRELVLMDTFYFNRSCKPENAVGLPEVVGFHDGADPGHGGCVYLRYKVQGEKDEHVATLLMAKAKVGKDKNTPRDEMNGLIVLCRLITTVVEGLSEPARSITIIGDSTCTILSVETSKKLKAWMTGKVDEINRHIELWKSMEIKVEELFYIQGELNPADILTRGDVKPEQIGFGSAWQTGPTFLSSSREDWPITRDFPGGEIPRSEVLVKCFALQLSQTDWDGVKKITEMASKTNQLQKVLGTVARIIRAAGKKDRCAILEEPSAKNLEDANLLLQITFGLYSIPNIVAGKYRNLVPIYSKGRWVTRGRLGGQLISLFGVEELVILDDKNHLSFLYMWAAHSSSHCYPKITLARSRTYAWIVHGYRLARRVCKSCNWCALQLKKKVEQRLGDLQPERLHTGLPPWTYVAIDLAAPILVRGMVNKRSQMKCWPLLIVCMLTGCIHISLMTGYGAKHFLMAWWIFCELRGYPSKVQSDSGSQLKASVPVVTWSDDEDPTKWDWKMVTTQTARKGTEFKIVEPGCQWRNGMAESQIKAMKKSLFQTASSSVLKAVNPKLDFQEWSLLLNRIANISNERPLGVRSMTEDTIIPLTPNQLLIGKTHGQVACPDSLPEEDFTRQKTYCDILLQTWWSNWFTQVLDNLVPYQSYRDAKRHINLCEGDVCLIKYDSKVAASYRYCVVSSVIKQEGIVRSVVVKLGIRGKDTKCREMRVGVQRLVLVTPVEKLSEELGENNAVEQVKLPVKDTESIKVTKELKDLEVPDWMKPSSSSRGRVTSVIGYSTIQGLNLEF